MLSLGRRNVNFEKFRMIQTINFEIARWSGRMQQEWKRMAINRANLHSLRSR